MSQRKRCSQCGRIKDNKHFRVRTREYGSSYQQGVCRKCEGEYEHEKDKSRKRMVISLKGGCCKCCGYFKNTSSLQLHHRDPDQKDFNWDDMKKLSWDKILREINKCDLVCANCHFELHNPQDNVEKEIHDEPQKCAHCGNLSYTNKYCSLQCAGLANRKVERPSCEVLDMMVKENGIRGTAKICSVTDNAIRQWLVAYGLREYKGMRPKSR